MRLDEVNSALRSLVAVAPKQRSSAMNMTLGTLYKNTGLTRDAINSYKSALRQNPMALEAIIALAELGRSECHHSTVMVLVRSLTVDCCPDSCCFGQEWLGLISGQSYRKDLLVVVVVTLARHLWAH